MSRVEFSTDEGSRVLRSVSRTLRPEREMADYTYDYIAHLRFACQSADVSVPLILENQVEEAINGK